MAKTWPNSSNSSLWVIDVPTEDLGEGNKLLSGSEVVLTQNRLLCRYLDTSSILAFSETCQTAKSISNSALLNSLLTAIIEGNESFAKKIVISRPELLLDQSAIVTDLSGKEIKGLTPLQAAICAGDVDMVKMIKEVLQQQVGIPLSFNPELEIQRQLTTIYPNGDIDAKEAEQIATAQEFKDYMRMNIFNAIKVATLEQVEFELKVPGQHKANSPLNVALHSFRAQFTSISRQDLIFNPFYLLMAFELYKEFEVNDPDEWDRHDLSWRQVIGYIQRHLSACYLQAFAQDICAIVCNREVLRRDFEFQHGNGFMSPRADDLNGYGLGYKLTAGGRGAWLGTCIPIDSGTTSMCTFIGPVVFRRYCEQKNQVWRAYAARVAATPELPTHSVRNRVRYSCCNIC